MDPVGEGLRFDGTGRGGTILPLAWARHAGRGRGGRALAGQMGGTGGGRGPSWCGRRPGIPEIPGHAGRAVSSLRRGNMQGVQFQPPAGQHPRGQSGRADPGDTPRRTAHLPRRACSSSLRRGTMQGVQFQPPAGQHPRGQSGRADPLGDTPRRTAHFRPPPRQFASTKRSYAIKLRFLFGPGSHTPLATAQRCLCVLPSSGPIVRLGI